MLTAYVLRRAAAVQRVSSTLLSAAAVRHLASATATITGDAALGIRTTLVPHDEEVVHDTEERLAHLHEAGSEHHDHPYAWSRAHGISSRGDGDSEAGSNLKSLAEEDAAGKVRGCPGPCNSVCNRVTSAASAVLGHHVMGASSLTIFASALAAFDPGCLSYPLPGCGRPRCRDRSPASPARVDQRADGSSASCIIKHDVRRAHRHDARVGGHRSTPHAGAKPERDGRR